MKKATILTIIIVCMPLLLAWLPTSAVIHAKRLLPKSKLSQELVEKIQTISGSVLAEESKYLLSLGNLQEIIWRLRESSAVENSTALQELLRQRLQNSAVKNIQDIPFGVNNSQLLQAVVN